MSLDEPIIWCDNRCSDKALRYLQIPLMVIRESGEARTINLCKRCYNEKLVQQGKQSLKSKEWREVAERKAHRGRLWKIFGSEQFLRGMWEYLTFKRAWARKVSADAPQEKQEGIQGQWQQESPFKEVLEQVKRSADTDCNAQIMRRAYNAMHFVHLVFIWRPLFVKVKSDRTHLVVLLHVSQSPPVHNHCMVAEHRCC